MNDVRPISVTIHQDKEVMPCICTEVNSQLLKWPSRRGFESNGLPRVRREMIVQDETILSILLSNPGQYTIKRAHCLVRTNPWCDS